MYQYTGCLFCLLLSLLLENDVVNNHLFSQNFVVVAFCLHSENDTVNNYLFGRNFIVVVSLMLDNSLIFTSTSYWCAHVKTIISLFNFKIRRSKNILFSKSHAIFFVKQKDQNFGNTRSYISSFPLRMAVKYTHRRVLRLNWRWCQDTWPRISQTRESILWCAAANLTAYLSASLDSTI